MSPAAVYAARTAERLELARVRSEARQRRRESAEHERARLEAERRRIARLHWYNGVGIRMGV